MSSLGSKEIMAKNLKHYIEKSGKDRRALAETWGFPYSTVTEWVNGNKYPRIDKIETMADYFGIQISDLIEDKKEPADETDGLSEKQKKFMQFLETVPDDKVDRLIRIMQSILEDDL